VEGFIHWWGWVSERVAEPQSGWVYLVSTALVAAAGAYFGAVGAQRAINRDNRNRRLREVLMGVNSAHSLATVILNQALALKKQHHLPMLEEWQKERARVVKAIEEGLSESSVAIHLETPPAIHFPISSLAELINGKLTLNGRPLGALAELFQAEHALMALVDAHTAIRQEFEGQSPEYVIPRYLALETPVGQDTRYQDIRLGFVSVLDDLLFFADVLSKDLLTYGEGVRNYVPWRERKRLPTLNVSLGVVPGNEYLIPRHAHHKEWHDSFTMVEETRRSFWHCVTSRFKRLKGG